MYEKAVRRVYKKAFSRNGSQSPSTSTSHCSEVQLCYCREGGSVAQPTDLRLYHLSAE